MADKKSTIRLRRLNCDSSATLFRTLKQRAFDEETSIKEITIRALEGYFKQT